MSIKKGKKLHQMEMKSIIESLFACQIPDVSIDGRPIIRIIPLDQLLQVSMGSTEQNTNIRS
jgi:DNA mismatch repair protein MutL